MPWVTPVAPIRGQRETSSSRAGRRGSTTEGQLYGHLRVGSNQLTVILHLKASQVTTAPRTCAPWFRRHGQLPRRNPAQPTSGRTKPVEPTRERQRTAESKPSGSRKADSTTSPQTSMPRFRHDRLADARRSAQPPSTRAAPSSQPGSTSLIWDGFDTTGSTSFGKAATRSSCGGVRTCVRRRRPGPASRQGCRNAGSRSRGSVRTLP